LPRLDLGRRVLLAVLAQLGLLLGFLFFAERSFPRSVLLLYVIGDAVAVFAWRLLVQRFYRLPTRRVLLVGGGPEAHEIAESIATRRWHGLAVAGYVPIPGESALAAAGPLVQCLGELADVPRLLEEGVADDVILAPPAANWQTELLGLLSAQRRQRTNVLLLPGPFESLVGAMRYRWVHDVPLIEVVRSDEWRLSRPLKRLLDLGAAVVLLVLALPALLAAALAVSLSSRGGVLFRQQRVGRGQRLFTLYKLRTMRANAEAETGEVLAQTDDPRTVPLGALLRRYRLDELPQLWNVLNGTMSLVGPRPERPGFVRRYLGEVPGYGERFFVLPGLTGLAQVNGDYHSSPRNKLRYDLAYIANWSLWLDLSILFRTVKIVLTSRGV
jgi:exopolysaccharide biosynthesis polyprenyl glycosylphosphotransferase